MKLSVNTPEGTRDRLFDVEHLLLIRINVSAADFVQQNVNLMQSSYIENFRNVAEWFLTRIV